MITRINLKFARVALFATLLLTVFVAFQLVQPTTAEATVATYPFKLTKSISDNYTPDPYTADEFKFNVSGYGIVTLDALTPDTAEKVVYLTAGTHTVSEVGPAGFVPADWTLQWSGPGCETANDGNGPVRPIEITVVETSVDYPLADDVGNACKADNQWPGEPAPILGCTDSEATNYDPAAEENDGSCEYENGDPDRGTIIIEKQTIPDGNQTDFTFNPSWDVVDFVLSDGEQKSTTLATGTYSISESVLTGWTQTSAVCTDGSPINAISLQANETVTCVITNTYNGGGNGDPDKGTIIIQKQTIPDGNQTLFTFNPSWSDVDFTLSDGGQSTSSKLATGTYSVVESPITGWTQTSAVCSDGSPINAIALQSGETVTCVVTNTLNGDTGGGEKGTIIIEKQTLPDGNQTVFTFNPSWSEVNFTLSDGGQHTQSGLAVGVYSVAETLATNWTQTSAVCSDGSPITAISLQANETVTCVITNTIDDGGENNVPRWLVFGYVWHDENENDAWDVEQPNPVDDESDLDGWTVQITNGGVTYSTTTDASGYYYFYVPAGTWTINEIIEEGWSKTFPNVNGHVVEVLGEVTFSEETHFFAKLMDFVVPTAYASVLPTTYGPYNFGNVQEDDSSSSGSDGSGPRRGSRRHSSNNNDDEPEGEVLGESTSIMPIGAPNTGAGGTAPHAVQFPILTAILPLSTSVRKVKNG